MKKKKIDVWASEGRPNRQIAKKIGRSSNVVELHMKQAIAYGKKYKGRTAMALTPRRKPVKSLGLHQISALSTAKIKEMAKVIASLAPLKGLE